MKKNMTRCMTLCGLLFCTLLAAQALANDILSLRMNVAFYQTPIATALNEVSEKGRFLWSYNASILHRDKRITHSCQQHTVREILHEILGGEYTFKQNGEYLILKKAKNPEKKLSGYLSDKKTGQKLPNVTIYDRTTLKSTTTDENGYYELPIKPRSEVVVATLDYRDTVIQVKSLEPRFVKIELVAPDSTGKGSKTDEILASVKSEFAELPNRLTGAFHLAKQKINEHNTKDDTLRRAFQISLVPNIGTNHRMSGSVINSFSINLLVGYARGTDGFEVGGVGNITRGHVNGCQMAGMFNVVGGAVNGTQIAGFNNHLRGNLNGVQISGFLNHARHCEGGGVQVGGFANTQPKGHVATQASGFLNVADTTHAQVAGFMNQANQVEGVQIAGFLNYAKVYNGGSQVAGFANVAKGEVNTQISGFLNMTDTLQGTQVAGFFNRARHIQGVQVGVINSARTVDGIQVGLLNFSRNGYFTLEASANEVHTANVMLKTGVPRFYAILALGFDPTGGTSESEGIWSSGVGFGRYFRREKTLGVTVDLIHRHVNKGGYDNARQEWEQAALALNLRLGNHFHLAAGPTVNLFISKNTTLRDDLTKNAFNTFNPTNNNNLQFWTGGTLALKYDF
jgi:hypothetical protein